MSSNQSIVCDVYIATIPENVQVGSVFPKQREQEINACSHERVKREKYCAWKLLEYALKHSLGLSLSELEFQKTEHGKWTTPACYFSITHCDGVVAVAVSLDKVGVDVEKCSDKLRSARFLTEQETLCLQALQECEQLGYLAKIWTQKESIFKAFLEGSFAPSRIETEEYKTLTKTLGNGYVISLATEVIEQIRWFENVEYL